MAIAGDVAGDLTLTIEAVRELQLAGVMSRVSWNTAKASVVNMPQIEKDRLDNFFDPQEG